MAVTDAATDVIGHIRQTVTPSLLNAHGAGAAELSHMLDGFYAIMATLLSDEQAVARLQHSASDTDLYSQLWNPTERDIIATELSQAHDLDKTITNDYLHAATPQAYHQLQRLAGSEPVATYLKKQVSHVRPYLPVWADAVLPAYLLGTVAPNVTAQPTVEPVLEPVSPVAYQESLHAHPKRDKGSFMKALLPILGLIILGGLAWALLSHFQKDPEPLAQPTVSEPVAAPVAATLLPANFTVTTGASGELYACRGSVADAATQAELLGAIENAFAASSNRCFFDVSPSYDTNLPAMERVPSILAMMKNVPFATAEFSGNQIALNAPDAVALQQLVNDVQALATDAQVFAAKPLDLQTQINQSLEASRLALAGLPVDPDPSDVARALSLQVINFDVDKAVIPEANKPLLDKAAEIIKSVPNMSLLIMGHTDATADNAHNVALSQERAAAVKEYLVAKGVDASKLMTKGMGEQYPIADNETEQGRFRNRRIEFAVYNQTQGDLAWYRDIPTLEQRSMTVVTMPDMSYDASAHQPTVTTIVNPDGTVTTVPTDNQVQMTPMSAMSDAMNDTSLNQGINAVPNQQYPTAQPVPNDQQIIDGGSGNLTNNTVSQDAFGNNGNTMNNGGISAQELDDLANSTIVAEPAINNSIND